jgi:hypothetical protein
MIDASVDMVYYITSFDISVKYGRAFMLKYTNE